jgi:hypothetical protein
MNDWPAEPRLDAGLRRMVESEVENARLDGVRSGASPVAVHVRGPVRGGTRFGVAGLAAVCLALIVAAVALRGTINVPNGGGGSSPVRASVTDGDFRLDLELAQETWSSTEAIQGRATLSYTGAGTAQIAGSGDGPLNFQYAEVGGTRNMGPAWVLSCGHFELDSGNSIVSPLRKSGGFGADDPNASFYTSFLADNEIHLPPGDWTITAIAWFSVPSSSGAPAESGTADCGGDERTMRASVQIHVTPEAASPSAESSAESPFETAAETASESPAASPSELESASTAPTEPDTSAWPSLSTQAPSSSVAPQAAGPGHWVAMGGAPASPIGAAVCLADGRILVVEQPGAQIFDPVSGKWASVGDPSATHPDGTATVLADGRVLLAGGLPTDPQPVAGALGGTAAAEIFDPATGKFSSTGSMTEGRWGHTATLLEDGRVLIAGGGVEHSMGDVRRTMATPRRPTGNATMSMVATAEIYDPSTGKFTKTGSMTEPRDGASAVRLQDGRVLIVGGGDEGNLAVASAELYDPAAGKFTKTGQMSVGRYGFQAILLPDGRVLIASGTNGQDDERSLEIYDPKAGKFVEAGSSGKRGYYLVAPLSDGRALFIGGWDATVTIPGTDLKTCDIYDPSTRQLSTAAAIDVGPAAELLVAVPLPDGRVVVFTSAGVRVFIP